MVEKNIIVERLWCCLGNHDKIYGAYYNKDEKSLLRIWGRRKKNLSHKLVKNVNHTVYLKLVCSKKEKGYVSVRDNEEIVTALDDAAARCHGFIKLEMRCLTDEFDVKDTIVICVDNSGLQNFETGVSYFLKKTLSNGLICVENMMGQDETVLKSRFSIEGT